MTRYCLTCNQELKNKRQDAKYCDENCKSKHYKKRKAMKEQQRILMEEKNKNVMEVS